VSEHFELRSGEVDYTLDDLREFARISSPTIVRVAKIVGWTLLIASSLTFALSRLFDTPYDPVDYLWCFVIAAALAIFGSPTQRAYTWRWQLRRSPLHAPQAYTVRNSAFEVESPKAHSTIKWSVFPRLRRTPDRLFLFVTRHSAYIIPRRAFGSDAEFEAFVAAVEERWEKRHRL
jgi:hypothetical protein